MMGRRKKKPRTRHKPTQPAGGAQLAKALLPFARVKLPEPGQEGECVWLYFGKPNPHALKGLHPGDPDIHGHLKLDDFKRARQLLRLP